MSKTWIFSSKGGMRIGANKLQNEERSSDGNIRIASKILYFENGIYRTAVKKEADLIKECDSFLSGQITEITEEQAAVKRGAQVVVVESASTHVQVD